MADNPFDGGARPTWCPGCGNFAILNALKRALPAAGLEPHQVMFVTGIGQSGKTNDYMHINGLHGLHGRPIPLATGFKLANPAMKVIVGHGDGDGYGEGGNHFIHAVRRNIGLVDMVHNNMVYALTKGQFSPTTPEGVVTPTSPSPDGVLERPLNALALALSQGGTFVARSYSFDLRHLTQMLTAALGHRGYAFIEVMQVCVTFNRRMDNAYYREHVYYLDQEGHDPTDRGAALAKAFEFPGGERIPVGILFQDESVPAYEERVAALREGSPAQGSPRARPKDDYRRLVQELLV